MQTFLPYADFYDSAACLDNSRLGKQRVECKQILLTIRHGGQYRNHPAVRMWVGFETCLAAYGRTVCEVWKDRGNEDNLAPFFYAYPGIDDDPPKPWWLGMDAFHASHRAALLMKDRAYYKQFGWTEVPYIAYLWPV